METEHDAADKPGSNFPQFVMIGSTIDWNAPMVPTRLIVELPFWLMTENGDVEITVNGCALMATIENSGVEVQRGHWYTRTQKSLLYIGPDRSAPASRVSVTELSAGGNLRRTRTLIKLETKANMDALRAHQENGNRHRDGEQYLKTFVLGHVAFLNELINLYRRVSVDPFVTEVSEWDVPVWVLVYEDYIFPVFLFPYSAGDHAPQGPGKPGESETSSFIGASIDDISWMSSTPSPPGEIELLDGWSLYYRGRYGDSIRSFVTAVEILLEARVRLELTRSGYDPGRVEKEISITRHDFARRIEQYCKMTNDRVPGPLLSWVPYINGIRLWEEIKRTRTLRHRVVHEGLRLDHTLRRPMRQVAETTTWFFDWLSGEGDFARRHSRHYSYFEAVRGEMFFEFEIGSKGVQVTSSHVSVMPSQLEAEGGPIVVESLEMDMIDPRLVLRSLYPAPNHHADLEHFVIMAFQILFQREGLYDSPMPPDLPLPYFDRFRIGSGVDEILVFLIDTHDRIRERDIEQIATCVAVRRNEGVKVSKAICIVNDQNGIPLELRRADTICEKCVKLATATSMSIVKSEDLSRLVLSTMKYDWDRSVVWESLLTPGWNGRVPVGVTNIGTVRHCYDKINVVRIELNGKETISLGDSLLFRGGLYFFEESVRSMQQNGLDVSTASNGYVGILVPGAKERLAKGMEVYRLDRGDGH